jgi:hypothetical protein
MSFILGKEVADATDRMNLNLRAHFRELFAQPMDIDLDRVR